MNIKDLVLKNKKLLSKIYIKIEEINKPDDKDLLDLLTLLQGYELLIFEIENKDNFNNVQNVLNVLLKIEKTLTDSLLELDFL